MQFRDSLGLRDFAESGLVRFKGGSYRRVWRQMAPGPAWRIGVTPGLNTGYARKFAGLREWSAWDWSKRLEHSFWTLNAPNLPSALPRSDKVDPGVGFALSRPESQPKDLHAFRAVDVHLMLNP